MKNKILLSLYFVIRHLTILLFVFLIGGTFKIEMYGLWILIYYIAINYLAVKYGIINGMNNFNKIHKKDFFISTSVLLLISNVCVYILYKFPTVEVLLLSILPIIMFHFIKTNEEKQRIIDINTKNEIDEYFKNKK